MTIHERMIPRTEREKDLLKYGRSQERERIIKLLEERTINKNEKGLTVDLQYVKDGVYASISLTPEITELLIALIKGEK